MSNELSTNILSGYDAKEDFAQMRPQDRIIPRLALMQFASRPVRERADNAMAGDYFDLSAKRVAAQMGKVIKLVPIVYWNEWLEWNPRQKTTLKDKPLILDRSLDPAGKLAKICGSREKVLNDEGKLVNRISEQYCFLCLLPEYTGNWFDPMQFNFAKSSHKIGRDWLNRLSMVRLDIPNAEGIMQKVQAPMFSGIWPFTSKCETDKITQQEYLVPVIGSAERTGAEHYPHLKDFTRQIKDQMNAIKQKSLDSAEVEREPSADDNVTTLDTTPSDM